MKTIFTLLLATITSASAFAYDGGRLSISVAAKRNLTVYINGRMYAADDHSILLHNIQPGNHSVAVYRSGGRNNGYGGRGNGRYDRRGELVYSSNVYVRPSYHVDIVINRFGKALIDERFIDDRNGRWEEDDWSDGYHGGDRNGGYNNGSGVAMSDGEFNRLAQRLESSWFGRLGAARDALTSHYFRTDQVRRILQLFTADSDKLELAKAAYRNTVDRQNYRQLYDQLSYSSQSALDRYLRDNRW